MNIINSNIQKFQNIVRNRLKYLKLVNSELDSIYLNICSIMNNLNEHIFLNKLIKKEKYILYVERIEQIFEKYKSIPNPTNIHIVNIIGNSSIKLIINDILEELYMLCEDIGAYKCSDVISILKVDNNDNWKKKLHFTYKKLILFYDNFFIPTSSKIIRDKQKINNILSIIKTENLSLPFPKKLELLGGTLLEKIDGAIIYFPFDNELIRITGYFKQDPVNITRYNGTFGNKLKLLVNDTNYLDIPEEFKSQFIEQISLRDFIVLSNREVILLIKRSYDELKKYKKKVLSSLINEFVKGTIEKQRRMITLFLMSTDEDQFKAHIIFDLISDQSLVFQAKPHAEQIYNSLHWSIKKNFKVVLKKLQDKKRKLESLSYSDIPYESRIVSMKVGDRVIKKAMDRLKEVKISKENSGKARQYLDGLLEIPFGFYHKEEIFSFFKDYSEKIDNFINILNCKLDELDNDGIIDLISELVNNYYIIVNENNEGNINRYISYVEENLIKFKDLLTITRDDIISESFEDKAITDLGFEIHEDENIINNQNVLSKYFEENNKIINTDNSIDLYKKSLKELKFYNNVKETLIENGLLNDNHIKLISEKLEDVENKIYKNDDKENNEDEIIVFIKYCFFNLIKFIYEWNKFKNDKKEYMNSVENTLHKSVYGHTETKQQIKRIVGQWINGEMNGQVFGLVGPPGVGKTTICKNGLSKCLVNKNGKSRPYAFLALGGATNGSYLVGHNYTYLGSRWGHIVEILMDTKCMNPIIYIDELDKVSATEHGKEIIGILTHMTDPVQNKEFHDKYFQGIDIDLSKVLFVFSYNDRGLIDRILRDRIQEITVKSLSKTEKLVIAKRYVLPEIYKSVGFSKDEVIFENKLIDDIIDNYTYEAGVRKLKEILLDIVRELNLKKILDDNLESPITITKEFIEEIMNGKPRVQRKVIAKKPQIGRVNGLYATECGMGGITIIEVMNTPCDKKRLCIEELTGSQGDVMKESMRCALTLVSNLLPDEVKKEIKEFGLHIHCPEASTPKDGPSAGVTITTAIISRVCKIPVRNYVAMTGEIDIHGNVHKIGGLEAKLNGALAAGVKKILIPFDNKSDYEKIIEKEREFELSKTFEEDVTLKVNKKTVSNDLDIKIVKNIHEVFKYAFMKHNYKFNKVN
jgi:ATP-dependent Lon protease